MCSDPVWFIHELEVAICFWSLPAWPLTSCPWVFPICIPISLWRIDVIFWLLFGCLLNVPGPKQEVGNCYCSLFLCLFFCFMHFSRLNPPPSLLNTPHRNLFPRVLFYPSLRSERDPGFHWPLHLRFVETNLTLICPSPKSFVFNLPDSGRHVTRPDQGLSMGRRENLGTRLPPSNMLEIKRPPREFHRELMVIQVPLLSVWMLHEEP